MSNKMVLKWLVLIGALLSTKVLGSAKPQVWDVDRLIRARNPDAVWTTTLRPSTTWKTLRSITYNPLLEKGSVGSASVQEASLVKSFKATQKSASNDSSSGWMYPPPGKLMYLLLSLVLFVASQLHL